MREHLAAKAAASGEVPLDENGQLPSPEDVRLKIGETLDVAERQIAILKTLGVLGGNV
jgi:hypothetical protein